MLRFSEMFVEALQRRWRRNANLNERAALDAGGLADIGLDAATRDALLRSPKGVPPRM